MIGGWTPGEGGRSSTLGALASACTRTASSATPARSAPASRRRRWRSCSGSSSRCAATRRRSRGASPPKARYSSSRSWSPRVEFREWTRSGTLRAPVFQGSETRTWTRRIASVRRAFMPAGCTFRCHGKGDLERCDQLRAGQRPGEALQRGLEEDRAFPPDRRRVGRAHPAEARGPGRRRGDPLRADRQGLRDRSRSLRDDHAGGARRARRRRRRARSTSRTSSTSTRSTRSTTTTPTTWCPTRARPRPTSCWWTPWRTPGRSRSPVW